MDLTPLTSSWVAQSRMNFSFASVGIIPPLEICCPRNSTDVVHCIRVSSTGTTLATFWVHWSVVGDWFVHWKLTWYIIRGNGGPSNVVDTFAGFLVTWTFYFLFPATYHVLGTVLWLYNSFFLWSCTLSPTVWWWEMYFIHCDVILIDSVPFTFISVATRPWARCLGTPQQDTRCM